jgi:hypothetical protein
MAKHKHLWDAYRFTGFLPEHTWSGIFGDPRARVIPLIRRGKKLFAVPVAFFIVPSTTGRYAGFAICPVPISAFTWKWKSAEFLVEGAGK